MRQFVPRAVAARALLALTTAALSTTALASCTAPVTEIVVVVDTNVPIPAQVDTVRITVDATTIGGDRTSSTIDLRASRPAVLGVVHRGGPLGPIEVTAEAIGGGTPLLSRRARVSFVRDRVMVLELFLDTRCVGASCSNEMTCGDDGTCRGLEHTLTEWTGQVPGLDASRPEVDGGPPRDGGVDGGGADGGVDAGCLPDEACNGFDDDCDTRIDEGFDLAADPLNCGACGVACAATCEARACAEAPVALAAGLAHTCALGSGGDVFCWGENGAGQLGLGDTASHPTPTQIPGLSGVVALGAGAEHTCAVTDAGAVYCWGGGGDGRLGDGGTADSSSPVLLTLEGGALAQALAVGGRHTCVVTTAGDVQCWGDNSNRQTGQAGGVGNVQDPLTVPGVTGAVSIAAGFEHACAALDSGDLWCWGANGSGQVIAGATSAEEGPTEVTIGAARSVEVALGTSHTCARGVDGRVRCWGSNSVGQVGNGTTAAPPMPAEAMGLTTALRLAAGGDETCAVLADGSARCWGENNERQIGDSAFTLSRSLMPHPVEGEATLSRIAVGDQHACARRASSEVVCWGTGDLGDATTMSASPVVTRVP